MKIDSPFEGFTKKAANIPNIWEMIMSNMSATDVARCLKVCHALRYVIAQSLNSNSSLRRKMDIAASVTAIRRCKLQSTTQCQFRHKYDAKQKKDLENSYGDIYALDQTWYHRCRYTGKISIIKRSDEGEVTVPSFRRWRLLDDYKRRNRHTVSLYPTMHSDKVYIKQVKEEMALFNLTVSKRDRTAEKFNPKHGIELELSKPACIRYRLFLMKQEQPIIPHPLVMVLAGDNGIPSKCVTLYPFQKKILDGGFPPNVYHQASQEQVLNKYEY